MSTYDVGYGKPPKSSQFKKGTSGNPRGRPKKEREPLIPRQLRKYVLRAMEEKISVQTSKGVKKITAHEMVLRAIRKRAAEGNPTAIKQWMAMATAAVSERFEEHRALRLLDRTLDDENRIMLALHEFAEGKPYDLYEKTKHLY